MVDPSGSRQGGQVLPSPPSLFPRLSNSMCLPLPSLSFSSHPPVIHLPSTMMRSRIHLRAPTRPPVTSGPSPSFSLPPGSLAWSYGTPLGGSSS
eukprot:10225653-Prorocentrum_lima.AAC.1